MRDPINRDCVGNMRNYRGVIWGAYIGNIWGVYRVYIRLYRDRLRMLPLQWRITWEEMEQEVEALSRRNEGSGVSGVEV